MVAPWRLAPMFYTVEHDGLKMPWCGRVFCNPPYGDQSKYWLNKCAIHGNAIALIFARVETKWFFDHVWKRADAVLFFDKRLKFIRPDGSTGTGASAPSCLVAYGQNNVEALHNSGIGGVIVDLKTVAIK